MESVIIHCMKKSKKEGKQMNSKKTPNYTMFCHFQTWGVGDNTVLMVAESHALWGLILGVVQ